MNKKDLKMLFHLAEKLYFKEYKKNGGCSVIPYAWAKDSSRGCFIAVSCFRVPSNNMEKLLRRWGCNDHEWRKRSDKE